MGVFDFLFGKKPKQGFISGHSGEADQIGFDRWKGAFGGIKNPGEFDPNAVKPFKFQMPGALDQKKGLFSEMLNNTQRSLERGRAGVLDKAKRDSMLTGSFNPNQFKNLAIESQQSVDESLGKYGTEAASNLASERAKYESDMQTNQAAEDRAARGQSLTEDQAMKEYFIKMLGLGNDMFVQPYAGQKGATQGSKGIFDTLVEGGSKVAGAYFCLPKGTLIETKNGTVKVENIKTGDEVSGGEVLKTSSFDRSPEHKFYLHKFKTGEVIMSDGHPYFDELISKEPVENPSQKTYDILTSDGFYFVNGVKLGSTIQEI